MMLVTLSLGAMPLIKLNNGVQMPAVAAGTWQYDADTAQQSVAAALSAGFTHIDTAHDYCADGSTGKCKTGSNQQGIAKTIAGVGRDSLFITTKVPGCGMQGIGRASCAADSLAAAEANLNELNTSYVDLLLIHFPPIGGCGALNCGVIQKQWAALESVYRAKKARAIGVSNFCVSCLKCLAKNASATVPAVNQIEYHIGMGADPEDLISTCRARGIVAQAYSPLGDNTSELISGSLVTSIGAAHQKSGVQVALRWIYQNGVAVTTKSTNPAHLADDLDLFDWSLTTDEKAQADAATSPKGTPSFMCSREGAGSAVEYEQR